MPTSKQKKPYPDFPLFYHQTGQWAKKVRGKLYYFGTDTTAAEEKWLREKDHLLAGKPRPTTPDGLTLRELVNQFLTRKKEHVDSRELSSRTWSGYYTSCESLLEALGKQIHVADLTPEDFAKYRARIARRFKSPVALGNEIQRVRTLLNFAWDELLIEKPVRFGGTFKKPSKKTVRKARHAAGPRMIEAADLRALIDAAGVQMRAMILLGINAAFGQTDVAGLPLSALDLDRGWVTFPREKTAIERRCPLWEETVAALRAAIAARPEPADFEACGLVFVTKYGRRWVRLAAKKGDDGKEKAGVVTDAVTLEFSKLLKAQKVNRKGLGFYAIRHTHRTVADRSKDQVAVDYIMGHVREDMASAYRERIDDDRLEAVVKIVREWLFEVK
jgi:integrase